MNQLSAIDILVKALGVVPEYDNPLNPLYEALGQLPLTLQDIRRQTTLLHELADEAQDQTFAVNKVIVSCKRISPTPLPILPLGF